MNDINKIILKYLGTPYEYLGSTLKGLDCINLCVLVGKDRGINIPNINHSNTNIHSYSGLFDVKDNINLWEKTTAQKDVLVVFKINGIARHVGYMLDDDQFIHIMQDSRVTVDRVSSFQWEKRVVGFYKYIGSDTEI